MPNLTLGPFLLLLSPAAQESPNFMIEMNVFIQLQTLELNPGSSGRVSTALRRAQPGNTPSPLFFSLSL